MVQPSFFNQIDFLKPKYYAVFCWGCNISISSRINGSIFSYGCVVSSTWKIYTSIRFQRMFTTSSPQGTVARWRCCRRPTRWDKRAPSWRSSYWGIWRGNVSSRWWSCDVGGGIWWGNVSSRRRSRDVRWRWLVRGNGDRFLSRRLPDSFHNWWWWRSSMLIICFCRCLHLLYLRHRKISSDWCLELCINLLQMFPNLYWKLTHFCFVTRT